MASMAPEQLLAREENNNIIKYKHVELPQALHTSSSRHLSKSKLPKLDTRNKPLDFRSKRATSVKGKFGFLH